MSLSAILAAVQAFATLGTQLFPQIYAIVTEVEKSLPQSSGVQKLEAAIAKFETWATTILGDVSTFSTAIPALVTPLINSAVADFNAFKNATATPAAAPSAPQAESEAPVPPAAS